MLAAVTGDDHVSILQSDAGVHPGSEVRITTVAGKAEKRAGQLEPVALGDPSGPADVPAGPVVVTLDCGRPGEVV